MGRPAAGTGTAVTSGPGPSGMAGRTCPVAARCIEERLPVQEQPQPPVGGVVTGADVDDVGAVMFLAGEDRDAGGVDVGDGPAVGVYEQLGGDRGGGKGHGPAS